MVLELKQPMSVAGGPAMFVALHHRSFVLAACQSRVCGCCAKHKPLLWLDVQADVVAYGQDAKPFFVAVIAVDFVRTQCFHVNPYVVKSLTIHVFHVQTPVAQP